MKSKVKSHGKALRKVGSPRVSRRTCPHCHCKLKTVQGLKRHINK
ncbi:hypothetical protein GQ600_1185 [Phytophthora cactorum]|nr:hypothetical protein GQ600_1185 [Phytophthora cactorum]